MTREYKMQNRKGETFQMGADISEVGKGDAVKVSGRLEKITGISKNSSNWDSTIRTESGRSYGMRQIQSYGKKVDK